MCSVFGILDIKSDAAALRPIALEMSKSFAIVVLTGQVFTHQIMQSLLMSVLLLLA